MPSDILVATQFAGVKTVPIIPDCAVSPLPFAAQISAPISSSAIIAAITFSRLLFKSSFIFYLALLSLADVPIATTSIGFSGI